MLNILNILPINLIYLNRIIEKKLFGSQNVYERLDNIKFHRKSLFISKLEYVDIKDQNKKWVYYIVKIFRNILPTVYKNVSLLLYRY